MEKQWERGELYEVLVHGRRLPDNPDIDRIAGFVAGLTIGGKTISQSEFEAAVGEVFSSKWLNYVKSLRKTERPKLSYQSGTDGHALIVSQRNFDVVTLPKDLSWGNNLKEAINSYNYLTRVASGTFGFFISPKLADKILKGET